MVSKPAEELNKHKILMQTPWEILQVPVGSGGVISSLSSGNILENLSDMGVEYIEVRHFAFENDSAQFFSIRDILNCTFTFDFSKCFFSWLMSGIIEFLSFTYIMPFC